jgi:hypothetical protein
MFCLHSFAHKAAKKHSTAQHSAAQRSNCNTTKLNLADIVIDNACAAYNQQSHILRQL